jgi:hypothetical protein
VRGYGFFSILAVMLILFVYLVVSKDRVPHVMPKPDPEATAAADAGTEGGALALASVDAGSADGAVARSTPPALESPVAPLGRPLRVAVLGWEHVSPGFGGDGGVSAMRGQPVETGVAENLAAIESRLAKGGADPGGADVAVLPLPSFVVAYERLRALEPRVFLVVAWSTGREELRGSKEASLSRAPEGEVKLVAAGGDSATLLGLFALDRAGVPPSRVHLSSAGAADVKSVPFAAALRGEAVEGERKLLLNTAEARRLVPVVAIAGAAALESNGGVYRTWAQAWLDGAERARVDAPGAARQISATQGAPEAIVLLERWGQMERATVADNAARLGLAPPSAAVPATVEALFARTWSLFRGAGLLASPPPEKPPVVSSVVAALAVGGANGADASDAGANKAQAAGGAALLAHRDPESADAALVASEAAFLADIFERDSVRVTAKNEKAAQSVVETATQKYPAVATRVTAGTGASASGGTVLEVFATP